MSVVHCPHCGGAVQLAMTAIDGQPAPAPAPARQPARQPAGDGGQQPRGGGGGRRRGGDPNAPLCMVCGERRVNQRRDGSYFETCIRCD